MGGRSVMVLEVVALVAVGLIGVVQGIQLILNPIPNALYDKVGPGGFVILLSVLLISVGVIRLIRHEKMFDEQQGKLEKNAIKRLVYAVGILAMYVGVIDVMGFLVATLLFVFSMLRFMGVKSWVSSAVLSIMFSLAVYLVFAKALNMELPHGLFSE